MKTTKSVIFRVEEKNEIDDISCRRSIPHSIKLDSPLQKEGAECVSLLTRIGRKEQAVRYYEAWLSSRIGQLWKEALTEKTQAPDVLDELYRLLSQLWNDEVSP